MITSQIGKLEIKIFLEQEESFLKSLSANAEIHAQTSRVLPVILMARSSSTAIKDGIRYFAVMLTTGFLGGSAGGCSSWGVGKRPG